MPFTKITYSPGDVLTSEQMNEIQDALVITEGNYEAHVGDRNNPHGVTLEQLGLDKTLSVLGAAADAGVVGEVINFLEAQLLSQANSISEIKESLKNTSSLANGDEVSY